MVWQRVKTAFVLIAAVSAAFWMGGAALSLLAFFVYCLINWEYYALSLPMSKRVVVLSVLVSLAMPLGFLFGGFRGWGAAVVGSVMLLFVFALLLMERSRHQPPIGLLMQVWFSGFCYTGVIGSSLVIAALSADRERIALLIACVVLTDTLAYAGGSLIGGPKLAPRISPKKTVSGGICGIAGAALGAVVGNMLLTQPLGSHWIALAFGVVAGVAATTGDLAESMVKRVYGVKDAGAWLPGHGGLLDRIDGLMFSMPLLFILPR